ncbi:Aldolase-type TIM barrel [Penicillium coprophilum]|uniref:Aldolase-type TIM barrel n=1 Tax=Penicillium coprophilum TaxID=36646 RepID=UPI00238D49C9|nr:Aldolase-type TIM barrel [Penicillium coprophilum]KAJ5165648.1 Aldolase-type TIM barrel [Penicillium coprophilum]
MLGPLTLAVALPLLPAANALVREDDVGRLPALGWNSWNAFGCEIDSKKIVTAANEVVNLGLKDLGYEYVNIDDCWSIKNKRDESTKRIIPDPTKFPDAVSTSHLLLMFWSKVSNICKALVRLPALNIPPVWGTRKSMRNRLPNGELTVGLIHSLWICFYQILKLADLKYDNCGVPSDWEDAYNDCVPDQGNFPNGTCPDLAKPAPEGYDWKTSKTYQRYTAMRDALLNVDRTIFYSLCDWGYAGVNSWGNQTGNSWRMSLDITPDWARIAEIANENSFLMNYANFWGYPDPDMLEVGNGDLTIEENRAHFALWAIMKSPLIIGTELDSIKDDHLAILKNKYLLDFNQDPVIGTPAHPYKWGYNSDWTFDPVHPAEYWSGPSSTLEGTLVLMLNSEDATSTRTAKWSDIPELKSHDAYKVIDAWTGKDLGCVKSEYSASLKSHDAAVLVVKGQC